VDGRDKPGHDGCDILARPANYLLKNRSDLPVCQVPFVKIFFFSEMPNHSKAFFILSR
jgi:hypothetical protein